MSEKIIGIIGKALEQNSFGVPTPYMQFFNQFGEPVVISPHGKGSLEKLFNFVDVFVLPGGEDVNPLRYKAKPDYFTGKPSTQLEYFDTYILPELFNLRKPIIGICRGIQTINVALGGTLKQHLLYHSRNEYERNELVHFVEIVGGKRFKVNSLHHQAIGILANRLTPLAKSDDGIIEAVEHQTLPVFAVQWHPEEIYDTFTINKIWEKIT